ncbi:MAG: zf-HC2 domain-containing protein [Acidobacteria bacterium]|nr:zf-HC2 domain-containing protein [Acidobacteriota bacterium]
MVCGELKHLVYFYLDGTVGKVKSDEFRLHIDVCEECARYVGVEERLRRFLRSRLRPRSAPDGLRERIHDAVVHS